MPRLTPPPNFDSTGRQEWIRSKLREEMEEDPFDENLTGGKCSLLGRKKQMMMRINEARKAAVKDVESVAARRRAADILSELHKRTIFAELAQKRESQESSRDIGKKKPALQDDVSEAPLKASSKSSGRVTIIAPPPEKTKPEVIRVTVHSAKGIRPADVNGLADPFCVVEVPGKPGMRAGNTL
eukprot:g25015.t1